MPAAAGKLRGTLGEVAHITKAGVPLDTDFNAPQDGIHVVDTANNTRWSREGGRWLSGLLAAELHPLDVLSGSSANHTIYAALPAILGGVYLVGAYASYIITTTNDGANFWTLQLQSKSNPNVDTARGASFNTSARSITNYYQNAIALGITLATTELSVSLAATKTGAPGPLYMQCVVLYRIVAA